LFSQETLIKTLLSENKTLLTGNESEKEVISNSFVYRPNQQKCSLLPYSHMFNFFLFSYSGFGGGTNLSRGSEGDFA